MSQGKPRICVIGSYAVGMTMSCGRFPREGETVMGHGFQMLHGGKGSNQAVGVARLGGATAFMSAVGEDPFGAAALKMLEEEGVDARFVKRMRGASTGVGFVIVSESGNNEIVIDLGANERLGAADVEPLRAVIAESAVLLVQLEVNAAAIARAIEIAHEVGTPVILNPAPFQKMPDAIFSKATYVTPNETEAAAMLGLADPGSLDGEGLAEAIYERFRTNTLVTLGEQGVFVRTGEVRRRVAAPRVKVIDTTGAGDTFSSALAVAIGEGKPILEAARFAVWAASMSVEVQGTVPSIPLRDAVEARMKISAQEVKP